MRESEASRAAVDTSEGGGLRGESARTCRGGASSVAQRLLRRRRRGLCVVIKPAHLPAKQLERGNSKNRCCRLGRKSVDARLCPDVARLAPRDPGRQRASSGSHRSWKESRKEQRRTCRGPHPNAMTQRVAWPVRALFLLLYTLPAPGHSHARSHCSPHRPALSRIPARSSRDPPSRRASPALVPTLGTVWAPVGQAKLMQ
jgi:hypothetical protein